MSVSIQRASASEGFRPGASIPLGDHDAFFPCFPCFRFPPYFQTLRKIFTILPFLIFIRRNFLRFFLKLSTTNFEFPPYFPCFSTFPPCFAKIIISPPTLTNFPPVLDKFSCFFHTLLVFCFPPTLTMMHLCITQCTH